MASKRNLKKDIDVVMSLALTDCFYVLEHNSNVNEEAVLKIAGDIVKKHRELRIKANHPDGKDNPKMVKKFYKQLVLELLQIADSSLEQLSSEVKKVAEK